MIGFSFFQFSRLDNKEFFLQIEFSDHELAISPNQDLMDFTAISRAETWRKGLGVTRKRITYRVPEIDAIEIYSGRIHEVRIIGKKDTEMSGRNEIISVDFRRWGCSDSWLNKLGEHLESLGIPIIDVDHSYTDAQAF